MIHTTRNRPNTADRLLLVSERFARLAGTVLLVPTLALSTTLQAATFTVTNQNNSGSGSLRSAVNAANLSPGPDTVIFDPLVTSITLTTGQIDITEALIIDG